MVAVDIVLPSTTMNRSKSPGKDNPSRFLGVATDNDEAVLLAESLSLASLPD